MVPGDASKRSGWVRATREKGSRVKRRIWIGALAALLVLSGGAWWVHLSVNAATATLTVTPKSTHVQQTLQVLVFTQPGTSGDIAGHAMTATSPAQTQTGPATGKSHYTTVYAWGIVYLSDVTLNFSGSVRIYSSFTSLSGVAIHTESFLATQGDDHFGVMATADQAGPGGNIPAYDINFPVVLRQASDGSPVGQAHAYSPYPFIEGADAYDVTVVQQSDIDGLAQPLIPQLTASTQQALKGQVAQQLQPGEQTALPTPQCTPTILPDHAVGTKATTLTVQVTVACYQVIYAERDFLPGVIHAQELQDSSKFYAGYRLVGDMLAGTPVLASADASHLSATLQVQASSIWAYHLEETDKTRMAERIVGKRLRRPKPCCSTSMPTVLQT